MLSPPEALVQIPWVVGFEDFLESGWVRAHRPLKPECASNGHTPGHGCPRLAGSLFLLACFLYPSLGKPPPTPPRTFLYLLIRSLLNQLKRSSELTTCRASLVDAQGVLSESVSLLTGRSLSWWGGVG